MKSKPEILSRLAAERARLEATVAALLPGDMEQPGVVGEWSVKDVLAHLAEWEAHMLTWVGASRRGEAVPGPEPDLTWRGLKEFNRRIYQAHRQDALEQVLASFGAAHARFMDMVAAMPEDEMLERGRYPLTKPDALYQWLVQYAQHDAWANLRIGEWLVRRRGAGMEAANPSATLLP